MKYEWRQAHCGAPGKKQEGEYKKQPRSGGTLLTAGFILRDNNGDILDKAAQRRHF